MPKTYAIQAMESEYQGLHGIVSYTIVICNTFNEACVEARLESEDVINSYGLEPEPNGEDWETDEEYADAWSEAIMYYIWEIPDLKGHTIEELNMMFSNDPRHFIQTYCVEC